MLKKIIKKQNLECNGKRFRTTEQLYNYKTEGRTMTAKQAEWFLMDNLGPHAYNPDNKPCAIGRVDFAPDNQPL